MTRGQTVNFDSAEKLLANEKAMFSGVQITFPKSQTGLSGHPEAIISRISRPKFQLPKKRGFFSRIESRSGIDRCAAVLRTASMARKARVVFEGAVYHVLNRGDR